MRKGHRRVDQFVGFRALGEITDQRVAGGARLRPDKFPTR